MTKSNCACSERVHRLRNGMRKYARPLLSTVVLIIVLQATFVFTHLVYVSTVDLARGSPITRTGVFGTFNEDMSLVSDDSGRQFQAKPADFGPFSIDVATSPLVVADSLACGIPPSQSVKGKAVLVKRGGCPFHDKVTFLQRWGPAAVIVGDDNDRSPLEFLAFVQQLGSAGIPSFFISEDDSKSLHSAETVSIQSIEGGVPAKMTELEVRIYGFYVLANVLFALVCTLLFRSFRSCSAARMAVKGTQYSDIRLFYNFLLWNLLAGAFFSCAYAVYRWRKDGRYAAKAAAKDTEIKGYALAKMDDSEQPPSYVEEVREPLLSDKN